MDGWMDSFSTLLHKHIYLQSVTVEGPPSLSRYYSSAKRTLLMGAASVTAAAAGGSSSPCCACPCEAAPEVGDEAWSGLPPGEEEEEVGGGVGEEEALVRMGWVVLSSGSPGGSLLECRMASARTSERRCSR